MTQPHSNDSNGKKKQTFFRHTPQKNKRTKINSRDPRSSLAPSITRAFHMRHSFISRVEGGKGSEGPSVVIKRFRNNHALWMIASSTPSCYIFHSSLLLHRSFAIPLLTSIHNAPPPTVSLYPHQRRRAEGSCNHLFTSPSVCHPASRGSIPSNMGLLSLLCWLWSPTTRNPLSSPTLLLPEKSSCSPSPSNHNPISMYPSSLSSPSPPSPSSPHSPKRPRLTFTLPTQIYAWLEAMAVTHNYGSVRKSVRDILAWASVGHEEDLEWLFGTDHEVPDIILEVDLACVTVAEPRVIAGRQVARGGEAVRLEMKLSAVLYDWLEDCVSKYGLSGASVVLDTLCRCVIVQGAADDVFGSVESGQLPTSSAELYHDLGIKCHHWR